MHLHDTVSVAYIMQGAAHSHLIVHTPTCALCSTLHAVRMYAGDGASHSNHCSGWLISTHCVPCEWSLIVEGLAQGVGSLVLLCSTASC